MVPTKLVYLEDMQKLQGDAHIQAIEQEPEKIAIYLDQTIFYPQGGGQPFDTGTISNEGGLFRVDEVRYSEGRVAHKGSYEHGSFNAADRVVMQVDESRRALHSRLHTAGHVIDKAILDLALSWQPTNAFHFPEGPYVEYEGELSPEQTVALQQSIQELCNRYIQKDCLVECRFVAKEDLEKLGAHVAANFANLDATKPVRIVMFEGLAIPCGGTHVKSLAEIGSMEITKIKKKGAAIRVGYDVIR